MPNVAVPERRDGHLRADGHEDRADTSHVALSVSPSRASQHPSSPSSGPRPSSLQPTGASGSSTSLHDGAKEATAQTHLTTRSLKKSASADSCIAQRSSAQLGPPTDGLQRDDYSAPVDEPGSPHPERVDGRTLSSTPSTMSLSGLLRSKVSRRRGASNANNSNANTTDNEASTQDESDFDKSVASSGTVRERVRARLLSLKSSKASGSGSEPVRDPPSLPARGTSASLSNLKTSNRSSSRLSPNSSTFIQEPGQRVSQETKRARSQSVGTANRGATSKLGKRFSFGNQTPRLEILREISIAVVGPSGCGKSTFIRKGLKKHDLSGSESFLATVTAGDMTRNISYSCRKAHLLTEFNTDTVLSVYEYDTSDWKVDNNSPLLSAWPSGLPHADGIFVCYDESVRTSFQDVIQLVSEYKSKGTPTLVIACKSDLEKRVPPEDAVRAVDPYSKLVEVSLFSDEGKRRMRGAVDVLVKQIVATQSPSQLRPIVKSESLGSSSVNLPPQRAERPKAVPLTVQTTMPAPIDLASPTSPPLPSIKRHPAPRSHSPSSTASTSKRSPTRARSMNDMLSDPQKLPVFSPYESDKDNAKLKSATSLSSSNTKSSESLAGAPPTTAPASASSSRAVENAASGVSNSHFPDTERQKARTPPTPWATLDELLEKLFFLAISGDDPSFISHFFLTYRRFATPRSVLLGMQKRMNELRQPTCDVALSCFAQMRICNLLEQWMRDYPCDFAVRGTFGALDAITRHILSHSHTLTYGTDFLPFVDMVRCKSFTDEEEAWALKAGDFSSAGSDTEADSVFDADLGTLGAETSTAASSLSPQPSRSSASEPPSSPRSSTRERRSSLPLNAMAFIKTPILSVFYNMDDHSPTTKEIISKLQRAAASLNNFESDEIANEITRRELDLFLKITRRDWLRHTLIPGKKDPTSDPIAKFNAHYNEIHEWAVSLILCHDKPKSRARQIEKLAEVASKLRMLNNYSALRALITAINQATYPGDQSMEIFKQKVDLHKKFLSSDILLRTTGAHQSYRMALRNTKGPCIPSLEVHTSDLRRAHEGNADTKEDDPTKINWAKYNMMGRFVATTTAIQQRCTGLNGYRLAENRPLGQLFDVTAMDYDMQQTRLAQPSDDDIPVSSTSYIGSHGKEGSVIKRILQW